jgi:hypothetical protein
MPETERDYEIGYGKPPAGRRFTPAEMQRQPSCRQRTNSAQLRTRPRPVGNVFGSLAWSQFR